MGNQPVAAGFASAVQDHSADTLKTFFSEIPEDQKNRIITAIDVVTTPRQGEPRAGVYLDAFNAINTKQTGFIDIDEFKSAMAALESKTTVADMEAVFKSFDMNKDSKLDFDEYVNMIQWTFQYEAQKRESQLKAIAAQSIPEASVPAETVSVPGASAVTEASAVAKVEPVCVKAAVLNGQATSDAGNMELCWQGENSVHCPETKTFPPSGEDYGVEFKIRVAHLDFCLVFTFKMAFREGTGASLEFCCGKHEQHVILDGPGRTLGLEGGSFGHGGPSNMYGEAPSVGDVHTLVVKRVSDLVTITLDGESPFPEKTMPASIGRVIARPWKNKFEILEFKLVSTGT